jgi:predicted transcriptional regulator
VSGFCPPRAHPLRHTDNVPRANRVQQLASDIARIQSQIKEEIEDGRIQDEKAIKVLGEIAKKSGYQTLEEYEAAAFKLLTPEEREKMDKMKKEVTALDENMGISHTVFRGLIAVGVLLSGASKS